MQNSNFVPGQYSGPPFQGWRTFVFVLRIWTKLSYSIMPNSKIIRGTITWTFVLGERNVYFRSLKMYQNAPTAMLNSNIFPGTIPRTPVLGERKICFYSPKMHHNSPTAMQNLKIGGINIPDLCFGVGEEYLFSFSENVPKLSYNNAEFKKIPCDNTLDSRFRGEESWFHFPENVPKRSYNNAELQKKSWTPGPPFLGRGGESCLLLKFGLTTPLEGRGEWLPLYMHVPMWEQLSIPGKRSGKRENLIISLALLELSQNVSPIW